MQRGNAWGRTMQKYRALSSFVVERPVLLYERSYSRFGDLDVPGLQGGADGQIHIFGGQKTV